MERLALILVTIFTLNVVFAHQIQQSVKTSPLIETNSDISSFYPPVSKNVRTRIQEQIENDQYLLKRANNVWIAHNPAQNLCIEFNGKGISIFPHANEDQKHYLSFELTHWGRFQSVPVTEANIRVENNRFEYHRNEINEWYVNEQKGIEQGFTLQQPPELQDGIKKYKPLTLTLHLESSLIPKVEDYGRKIGLYTPKGEKYLSYQKYHVWDANGTALPATMQLNEDRNKKYSYSLTLQVNDKDAIYPIIIDPTFVSESKKVNTADNQSGDSFGWSVAISGDTVVVGAKEDDDNGSNSGSAYVFTRNQGGVDNWGLVKKLTPNDGNEFDYFGFSVAISGDTVVIGAPLDDGNNISAVGSAYIFERNQGGVDNWGEVRKINASDGSEYDYFGHSIALNENTLAIVALENANSDFISGSAYIFERNQGGVDNWGEIRKINAYDAIPGDRFGQAIALSGDNLVVGAPTDNDKGVDSGSSYIFERDHGGNNNWGQVKKLTASDGTADDFFGYSIAISSDTVVIGAFGDDINGYKSGSAYIYDRNAGGTGNWGEMKKLIPSDGASNDYFGWSVAVSGAAVIVGAPEDDDIVFNSGSVYLFDRHQGGIDNWGQQQKYTVSNSELGDMFGQAVAISNSTLVSGQKEAVYISNIISYDVIETAPYFPIDQGNSWTYQENGTHTTRTVTVSGTELINGALTTKVLNTANEQFFYTNDVNGVRLHREIGTDNTSVTFLTPIVLAPALIQQSSESINTTGNASLYIPGSGTFSGSYIASSTWQALETVILPAGTFRNAVKLHLSITFYGGISGSNTSTYWLIPDLGMIKQITESGGDTTILELSDTNLQIPVVDLGISIDDSPDPVGANENLSYELNIQNTGSSIARNIMVSNSLPWQVSHANTSGSGWSCDHSNSIVACTRDRLDAGTSSSITINTQTNLNNVDGEIYINRANVYTLSSENSLLNNSASEVTTLYIDTDGDGLRNLEDTDDDDDGMPDSYEEQYGLNALVNDADFDKDNDGYSNIDEYKAGTSPDDPEDYPFRSKAWRAIIPFILNQ